MARLRAGHGARRTKRSQRAQSMEPPIIFRRDKRQSAPRLHRSGSMGIRDNFTNRLEWIQEQDWDRVFRSGLSVWLSGPPCRQLSVVLCETVPGQRQREAVGGAVSFFRVNPEHSLTLLNLLLLRAVLKTGLGHKEILG